MEKYTGLIYRAYCLVTKKSYIGLTVNSLKIRKSSHLNDAFGKRNSLLHFHKALRKHGINNFEWSILDTIEAESLESLHDCLDILEVKYIKQFNSYENGYNMTPGGQKGSSTRELKKVTIYDLDGNVIRYCLSTRDASEYLKVPIATVRAVILKSQNFLYRNYTRYIIKYSDELLTQLEIDYVKSLTYNTPIYMFNQSGDMILQFETLKKASDILQINQSTICGCCNKALVSTTIENKLYTFRRYSELTEEDKKSLIKPFKHKKKIRVYDYSTNKIIGTYDSILEASKELNIPYSSLNKYIREKRKCICIRDFKVKVKEINV